MAAPAPPEAMASLEELEELGRLANSAKDNAKAALEASALAATAADSAVAAVAAATAALRSLTIDGASTRTIIRERPIAKSGEDAHTVNLDGGAEKPPLPQKVESQAVSDRTVPTPTPSPVATTKSPKHSDAIVLDDVGSPESDQEAPKPKKTRTLVGAHGKQVARSKEREEKTKESRRDSRTDTKKPRPAPSEVRRKRGSVRTLNGEVANDKARVSTKSSRSIASTVSEPPIRHVTTEVTRQCNSASVGRKSPHAKPVRAAKVATKSKDGSATTRTNSQRRQAPKIDRKKLHGDGWARENARLDRKDQPTSEDSPIPLELARRDHNRNAVVKALPTRRRRLSSKDGPSLPEIQATSPINSPPRANLQAERRDKSRSQPRGKVDQRGRGTRLPAVAASESAIEEFAEHEKSLLQLLSSMHNLESLWASVSHANGKNVVSLASLGKELATNLKLAHANNEAVLTRSHALAIKRARSKRGKSDGVDVVLHREFPRLIVNIVALCKLLQVTGTSDIGEIRADVALFRDIANKLGATSFPTAGKEASGSTRKSDKNVLTHDEITKWFADNGCAIGVDVRAVTSHFELRSMVREARRRPKQPVPSKSSGRSSRQANNFEELCQRYDKLRDKVIEIILDYENLAKLWAEIVGDGDTCDSNVVAQALATKFSFTTERDAAERVAHMLNDGGVSVQCESLPKFMIYLVSINQFMEVYGTATTERISSIAFKRMMSKLGIQQTQEQLDAEFRKLAPKGQALSLADASKWFSRNSCTPLEEQLFTIAKDEMRTHRDREARQAAAKLAKSNSANRKSFKMAEKAKMNKSSRRRAAGARTQKSADTEEDLSGEKAKGDAPGRELQPIPSP